MTLTSPWPAPFSAPSPSSVGLYLAVALATFLPRLILSLVYPEVIGDGHAYLTVARNILENSCVSPSDPSTGACVPHWGGNQLPGYAAFVAASTWLGGSVLADAAATGVAQSLVAALVAMRLAHALTPYLTATRVIVVAGLVLGLSPAHVAWSRLILTESLAVSLAIWLFAELLLSHAEGRLRLLPIAFVLACSIFVRYDGVLLVLPVALLGFRLHSPTVALRRGAAIALIVAVPLAVWTARSLSIGLPFPPPLTHSPGEEVSSPQGYFSWLKTWLGNQYELQTTLWPALALNYGVINVSERAYVDETERSRVLSLLRTLATHDGEPFPPDIDAAFAELAAARRAARPWERWITTPARRVAWMSLNPLTSLGWPSDGDAVGQIRSTLARGHETEALRIAFAHPLTTGGKLVNTLYRILLYGLLVVVLFSRRARAAPGVGLLLQLSVVYWLARAGFFAVGGFGGPESRLLVEALPGLEMAVAMGVLALIAKRQPGEWPG